MLKDIASIVQICFYVVGATIAILTYRSAKRGLLNTVNTEYHKKVIEHLERLSEILYSEFDPESDAYYIRSFNIAEKVRETFKIHNEGIKEGAVVNNIFRVVRDIGQTELELRLQKLIKEIKSSPFLPDHVVNYVVEHLTERLDVIDTVKAEQFVIFIEPLVIETQLIIVEEDHSEPGINLAFNCESFEERVYSVLEKRGFLNKAAEEEVHKIRLMIKGYLKSFNPLP